jgi:hypothetical protein
MTSTPGSVVPESPETKDNQYKSHFNGQTSVTSGAKHLYP